MNRKNIIGIILCLIVTSIFSFHYIVAKSVLSNGVSPYSLSAWRGLLGGGILLLVFRKKLNFNILKSNAVSIFFISFLGFFINQIFFMKGLILTTPLDVSIISNTIPIITAIFAVSIGLEKTNSRKVAGILITFCLVCYLLVNKDSNSSGEILNPGNTLIFLNVLAFCCAFVLGKKLLTKSFPFEILSGLMLFLGGFMMVFVAQEKMVDVITFSTKGSIQFTQIVFEILISTSAAYLLNMKSLQLMSATKVSFFIYLQPIITGFGDFFINGNVPSPMLILVFTGIMFGGYLVVLQKTE